MGEHRDFTAVQQYANSVINNVERVIIGKREAIEMLIVAQHCEGHVLIEDAPGTGKTMLARSIAISLGLDFNAPHSKPLKNMRKNSQPSCLTIKWN